MSDMPGHKYKCPNNDKNRKKKYFMSLTLKKYKNLF